MRIETVIELSEAEQRFADTVGTARTAWARQRGCADRVRPATEELRARYDQTGAGAEIAVRRLLGLPYVGAMVEYEEGRADLRLHTKLLDVKSTEYPGGMLQRHRASTSRADAYLLVIRQERRYLMVGWATATELMREANYGNGRWANSYTLAQNQLRCFTTLRTWARGAQPADRCDLGKRATGGAEAGHARAG
jgi:hypothetical protein